MLHKNEKQRLQLACTPLSLWFKAVGASCLYLCPNEKFSFVILMYLLGKIYIICLNSIIPALSRLSSVPAAESPFNLPQAQLGGTCLLGPYASTPTLTQAQGSLLLAGEGLPETRALLKEEGTPHDLSLEEVLQMYLLLAFSFAMNDNAFVLMKCHIPYTASTSFKLSSAARIIQLWKKNPLPSLIFIFCLIAQMLWY